MAEQTPASPDVQSLVDQAMAEANAAAPAPKQKSDAKPQAQAPQSVAVPEVGAAGDSHSTTGIELLSDVDLNVKIELGRTQMLVEDVLRLGEGAVVELDKLAGDPVDVYVNERLVARGEVLVLNDNFCIRISEIVAGLGKTKEAVAEAVGAESGAE